ncbi:MAG: PIN domain-containing protein, partial [Candidatus Competibacteraceae bacterium]
LPGPTESEIVRQIRDRSKEALKALEDARRRAPFLAKWKHFPPTQTHYMTDWEVMRVAMAEWQEFLKNFNVVKLDYSGVMKTVMQWYDRVTPPFREGKKRKEFPDAFAIAIVEAYARSTTSSIAVVIEWARIESMLKAAGCKVVEGAGSSVTFEFAGRKMTLHRPHPGKEALRYRVLAVREFIERMGIKP